MMKLALDDMRQGSPKENETGHKVDVDKSDWSRQYIEAAVLSSAPTVPSK